MDTRHLPRPVPQRRPVRPAAVPGRQRADADLRDHGRHQPGARQLLHDRRLPRVRARAAVRRPASSRGCWSPASCSPSVFGYLLEWVFFSFLYERDHLQQVLMTYALILVFEELRSILVGNDVHGVPAPAWLAGSFRLGDADDLPGVPPVRLGGLHRRRARRCTAVVNRTRLGMMIRAGASNRDMVRGLGIDIRLLYRIVFAGGVALAALAGMIAAPLSSVYPGHGRQRADHLLRRRRDRRHRLDHRRADRVAAGRLRRHLRQGVLRRMAAASASTC